MGRLDGRTAIITGAADGIGLGIAHRFAAEGANLLLADIQGDAVRKVAAELAAEHGIQAQARTADVGVKQEVVALVGAAADSWGAIDVLVNNAWGGGTLSRFERKTDEGLNAAFRVGYFGPVWAMQAAFPIMKRAGYGRVINLCSLNGVNAHMGTTEYNSAKEALRSASRTAAREWAPYGICVNVICPGAKTAASRRVFAENPELEAAADASNPMGRLGDPQEDIAPVALFLASEDCRYLTGNTLFVDGGSHINGAPWAPVLPE